MKSILCSIFILAALTGCGGPEGFDYKEYSQEASEMADVIIDKCGDMEPYPCRNSSMKLTRQSVSLSDYIDVCNALVEKTGEDPEECPEEYK